MNASNTDNYNSATAVKTAIDYLNEALDNQKKKNERTLFMVTIKQAIEDLNHSELIPHDPNHTICTTSGELIILLESLQMYENKDKSIQIHKMMNIHKNEVKSFLKELNFLALCNRDIEYSLLFDTESEKPHLSISRTNEIPDKSSVTELTRIVYNTTCFDNTYESNLKHQKEFEENKLNDYFDAIRFDTSF